MKIAAADATGRPAAATALALETTLIIRLHFAQNSESSYGRVELISASMLEIPFDYGRSYQYPREVWRPTRVEIRCAVGPGAALPARTSDPAEDLRPRPRRHIVPAREQNTRKIVVITREFEVLRVVLAGILLARNATFAWPS